MCPDTISKVVQVEHNSCQPLLSCHSWGAQAQPLQNEQLSPGFPFLQTKEMLGCWRFFGFVGVFFFPLYLQPPPPFFFLIFPLLPFSFSFFLIFLWPFSFPIPPSPTLYLVTQSRNQQIADHLFKDILEMIRLSWEGGGGRQHTEQH